MNKKMKRLITILMTLAMILSLESGVTMPRKVQAAGYGLKNPFTDNRGVTTWNCVYFGNYYQCDSDGTIKDPIKWRVLYVDGDDAFLLADQILDSKSYNTSYTSVTWEKCTLRSWLNGYGAFSNEENKDYSNDNFIDTAFTSAEKSAILRTDVINEDNPHYGTEGGNNTTDQVYLLSCEEACDTSYGFNSDLHSIISNDTRISTNTAYAAGKSGMNSVDQADCWWLRSPGSCCDEALYVYSSGYGSYNYSYIRDRGGYIGVRPALHLNLSSNLWSYAGTVSSEKESQISGNFVGTLKGYNTSSRKATLDDKKLTVSNEIDDKKVTGLLADHTSRLVAVTIKKGVITQIMAAEDILKPTIEIQPEVSEIVYEDSKFSKKKFDLNLVIRCDVKKPYQLDQVLFAAGESSGLATKISKVTLDSKFVDSGSIPYYLKDGFFDSKDISYEKEMSLSLGLGQTQTISLTAYLKDDYIPENVSNATMFTAQLNDDATTQVNKTVNIANMDKAKKIAQTKQSVSVNTPEMNTINTILNGTQAAFDDTTLREYLTDNEVKAVTAQVNNWIYTSNALNSIITDDSENGLIKKLLKKANLSKEDLADKVFEKLGISQAKGMLTVGKNYNGTLKFEATDKNTGKDIVIVFTTKMTFYAFNGSQVSYGGFGTISYKIQKEGFNAKSSKTDLKCEKNGNGVGVITYANYDSFVSSLKKIMEKQIHSCYSKIYGKGIDEISDELLSGTFRKIVVGKYGSASEMVYTGLKYAYTGYTEEDAKKSVKDVTIILAKGLNEKKTKVGVHCPVDVSVYDSDGNLCAQIVDNQVVDGYDDVAVYVDNDDKYLLLPDDDYVIEYVGNDEGSMTCDIEEYENNELVRSLTYENIPLSEDRKYSNFLEAGRRQGLALYNLNDEEGENVTASSAEGFEEKEIKAEKLSLDRELLELEVGESYTLQEAMEPYNTTESQVTWESGDDQVASVDENGTVTALEAGQVQITAKGQSGDLSAVCQVTVSQKQTSPSPSVIPTENPSSYPNVSAVPDLPNPSHTPQPPHSAKPTSTLRPGSTGSLTPSATVRPSVTASPLPKTTVSPSATSVITQTFRKGQVFKDVKTKAYYKILSVTASVSKAAYLCPIDKKVKKVTIKENVTWKGKKFKVTQIGNKAFKDYKKLQKVIIGRNVSVIGKKTFAGCKSLKVVILTGSKQKHLKNVIAEYSKKTKLKIVRKRMQKYMEVN